MGEPKLVPEESWNKAERLAFVNAVAPTLREHVNRTAGRRVGVVDAGGKVVGYTTLADVQKSLLAKHALEIELQPDERPAEVFCEKCGLPFRRNERDRRMRCDRCTFLSCSGCGKKLPRNYSAPSMQSKVGVPRCRPCFLNQSTESLSPCADCGVKVARNSEWQYRKRWGDEVPLRCGGCNRIARKLPGPQCSGCGSELARSALSGARARAGKAPMCRACYSGEARAAVAREKIANDPKFARKVRRAMAKGQARNEAIKVPRKRCGGCDRQLAVTATSKAGSVRSMCRSCSMKYRWALRRAAVPAKEAAQ